MKIRNKYFKVFLTSFACTLAAAVVMVSFQYFSNNAEEDGLVDRVLTEIPSQLDTELEARKAVVREHDIEFQKVLASIKYVMGTDGQAAFFEKLRNVDFSSTVYLVGRNGVIVNGTDSSCKGKKLKDVCLLSDDEYKRLMAGGDANTDPHLTDDGALIKFYATDCEGGRLVSPFILKGKYASVYSVEMLGNLFGAVDERMFVTFIDNATLKLGVLKTFVADFTGQPISALNLDESVTRNPVSGHSEVMGFGYKYKTIQYRSDILGDYTILALYTNEGAVPFGPLCILLATILLVAFLLQLYCMYIDEEPGKLQIRVTGLHPVGKKGSSFDTEKARVLLPFSLIGIVIVTLVGFYLNTLYIVGSQGWTLRWNIQQLSESLSKMDKTYIDNVGAETEGVASFLRVTAEVLEDKQSSLLGSDDARIRKVKDGSGELRQVEICNPWLAGLSKAENAVDISVFDFEGRLVSTSGTQRNLGFSRSESSSAPVFEVLDGVVESSQFLFDDYFVVCVPFNLTTGGSFSDALLVSRFDRTLVQDGSIRETMAGTFNTAREDVNCNYIMTTSSSADRKVIYEAESLSGISAGMPEEAFADGYIGMHKVNGTRNMVVTSKVSGHRNDYFILSFIPCKIVYSSRLESTASTFAVTLLVILVLFCILLFYSPEETESLKAEVAKETEARKSMTTIQLEKLNVAQKRMPSSSQRIMAVFRKIWLVVLLLVTLVLFFGLSTSPTETLSAYMMSFAWQRGINIFSITTMFIVILSFAFIMKILTKLMSVLGKALNTSAETTCQLLLSLARYAGYITAVFITLYMLGVNTTGVLASLGAFSVMVGLGAQNLIKDILAGISIIMEKDYKVGDIVNIGGFCGKVNEIGIRTTKVEDIEGNVKIFYNSGVSGVVNMTCKPSSVRLDVKLDAQHSFEQSEILLKKFFERIEGKYSQIKGNCHYLGVQDSTSAFNVFRFAVPCDEIDRVPLRRSLVKELSEFCAEENIKKL